MSLQTIFDAVAEKLNDVDGLRALSYVPDKIMPPQAWPQLSSLNPRLTMQRGAESITFDVIVAVSLGGGDRVRAKIMNEFQETSGARSVRQALEADPTLGGAVDDLVVQPYGDTGFQEISGVTYLLGRWPVFVVL